MILSVLCRFNDMRHAKHGQLGTDKTEARPRQINISVDKLARRNFVYDEGYRGVFDDDASPVTNNLACHLLSFFLAIHLLTDQPSLRSALCDDCTYFDRSLMRLTVLS